LTVINIKTNESITFGVLLPHLIRNHGFFQGKQSPFRLDPEKVVKVLELPCAKTSFTWRTLEPNIDYGIYYNIEPYWRHNSGSNTFISQENLKNLDDFALEIFTDINCKCYVLPCDILDSRSNKFCSKLDNLPFIDKWKLLINYKTLESKKIYDEFGMEFNPFGSCGVMKNSKLQ